VNAAEHARALVAGTNVATLATLDADGAPWASLVAFAALADGTPVLCVSALAEHGRNLRRDPRASLVIAGPARGRDPLEAARVTLSGITRQPTPADAVQAARDAFLAAVPHAAAYVDFADFSVWELAVQRVRWVGGYGRMETVAAADYARASRS
jgi:heme iron utilization protein